MISLCDRHKRWLDEVLDEAESAIEKKVFRLLPDDCVLTRETSVRILRNWMTQLETRIAEIAGSESKFFWLQLIARIAPENVFGVETSTVWLYRQTLKLAVVKYGADSGRRLVTAGSDIERLYNWAMDGGDEEPVPVSAGKGSIVLPGYLTRQDVADAYLLELLSTRYYLCTSALRMVWKGGGVVVRDGRFGGVDSDPGVTDMYHLYDKRNELSGVVRGVGSLAGGDSLSDEERFPVLVPYLNVKRLEIGREVLTPGRIKELPKERPKSGEGFVPNYWIGSIELRSLCRFMNVFDDELLAEWGCSGSEICGMVGAVGTVAGMEWLRRVETRWQLYQRGYVLSSSYRRFEETFRPVFEVITARLSGTSAASERFRKVFDVLTYKDFASISLWDREGWRPFLEFERGILIDHASLMFVADTMLAPIASARGAAGRKKGRNFEDELRQFLRRYVEGWSEWKFRERIHFTHHFAKAGGEREIDVSFIQGDCLFLVSCKAAGFGAVLDRGEGRAIWKRFEAIQGWLAGVDEVTDALAAEPEGRDYCVPPGVRWVVGVCCSPHVDYFPVRSSDVFLTDRIPRVCVPEELVEFLAGFNAKNEAGKGRTWIREIRR